MATFAIGVLLIYLSLLKWTLHYSLLLCYSTKYRAGAIAPFIKQNIKVNYIIRKELGHCDWIGTIIRTKNTTLEVNAIYRSSTDKASN